MNIVLGYLAVFVGCFFEGEISIITAAYAANRGFLDIWIVVPIAILAAQTVDWSWFFLGRKRGQLFIEKRPKLKVKSEKLLSMLNKYGTGLMLSYRFLYGSRTVVPIIIGMSKTSSIKFFPLSLIGTIAWASVVSSAGYFFGAVLEANFKKLEHYEIETLVVIILLAAAVTLVLRIHKHRANV